MATETTNLKLTKPDKTDFYDIGILNKNMDVIDTEIQKASVEIDNINHVLDDAVYLGDDEEISSPMLRDADLLGGEPKSYFEGLINAVKDVMKDALPKKVQTVENITGNNLDTLLERGIYFGFGYDLINAPYKDAYNVITIPYHASMPNDWGSQILIPLNGIAKPIVYRTKANNAWGAWKGDNLAIPFNCTPATGLKITSSSCYQIGSRAYIEICVERIDGANFANGLLEICTLPLAISVTLVAVSGAGIDVNGMPKTLTQGMLTAWDSKIRISTTTSDVKTIGINVSCAINI